MDSRPTRPSNRVSPASALVAKNAAAKPKQDAAIYKKVIRDIGLKVTQQRLTILEQILGGRKHVTAQEVFELVVERSPEIGFATVYRFLRTLSDHGYVSEVRMRGLPARYEWKSKEHHDHITCVECGKIAEFESEQIEKLQIEVAEKLGFKLTDHILELYGTCSQCRIRIPRDPDLL
jgi:Fur family ferric uptake transcriptional regulator